MARSRIGFFALVLAVAALPAVAETYTATLTNGTTFTTRYRPQEASWDSSLILLLTDVGNWMAIPAAEVESVTSESESKGFGLRIDDRTLVFGWAPNDNPLPGDEGPAAQPGGDALERFLNRSYDQQQFVEPGDAGGGGVPLYSFSYTGGGGGGVATGGGGGGTAPPSTPPSAGSGRPPSGVQ